MASQYVGLYGVFLLGRMLITSVTDYRSSSLVLSLVQFTETLRTALLPWPQEEAALLHSSKPAFPKSNPIKPPGSITYQCFFCCSLILHGLFSCNHHSAEDSTLHLALSFSGGSISEPIVKQMGFFLVRASYPAYSNKSANPRQRYICLELLMWYIIQNTAQWL